DLSRAVAPARRRYSCESRIERLPPVAIEPHTRLRRTCSAVETNSVRTFVQSHSSSSATSIGSPVELPCPISERATRITTLLSGLTTIQAVISAPFSLAAAWARTGAGIVSSSARPPPAAAETLRKSRRDWRNGTVIASLSCFADAGGAPEIRPDLFCAYSRAPATAQAKAGRAFVLHTGARMPAVLCFNSRLVR